MMLDTGKIQRIGKSFVWLVAALLLLAGWRAAQTAVSPAATAQSEEITPAETTTPTPNATIQSLPVPDNLPVITESGLAPAPVPRTFENSLPQHDLQRYVVQRGDTPNSIADQFGIQAETLLGGNPQLSEESSLLQTGVELLILPIDGVLHTVQPGDTLEDLSAQYGIPVEEIIAYEPNNLSFPYRLEPETQILIPGAVRELFVWSPPDLSSVTDSASFGGTALVVGTGSFIFPVNSRNYTQFYWYGHRGLDVGLPEGSAVFAADTGTVTYAGWNNWGYGNLIVVNHGNGYETLYAHLSSINVVPGQIVYQGNVIGGTGNTGNSSGPHIHFEIRINGNQDDPCWYLGC